MSLAHIYVIHGRVWLSTVITHEATTLAYHRACFKVRGLDWKRKFLSKEECEVEMNFQNMQRGARGVDYQGAQFWRTLNLHTSLLIVYHYLSLHYWNNLFFDKSWIKTTKIISFLKSIYKSIMTIQISYLFSKHLLEF